MSGILLAAAVALLAPTPSALAARREFSRCQILLTDLMSWLGEAVENSSMRDARLHEGHDTLKVRFGLSLTPGMELLVNPRGFELEDGVRLPGRRPIRMTVRKVKSVRHPRGPMYIKALLDSPKTGPFWVPHFVLVRHVLNEGRLRRSTLFAPGEIVVIGEKDSGPRIYERFDGEGHVGLPPEGVPLLARFKGLDPSGTPVVEIQVRHPFDGLPPTLVRVPADDLKANVSGTATKLSWHIRRLAWVRPSIAPGEAVRYRGKDGLMRPAKFVRLLGNYRTVEITTAGGRKKRLPRNQVFKMAGSEPPRTPRFAFPYLNATLDAPRGVLREFFDGAAAIASHPDFWTLGTRSRLYHLVRYVQLIVPWTEAGRRAETAGLRTFDDITCAGAGVCRHSSTLLAVILAEAGIHARILEYHPPGKVAHQWVEVDLPRADGALAGGPIDTWVLDPTPQANGPQDILTLREHEEHASQKADSWAAIYYANPARGIVPTLP